MEENQLPPIPPVSQPVEPVEPVLPVPPTVQSFPPVPPVPPIQTFQPVPPVNQPVQPIESVIQPKKKKKLSFILILLVTIILAAIAVATAWKLYQRGLKPVAPSVPESKPKAQQGDELPEDITPGAGCRLCNLTGTPTATPLPTSTPPPAGEPYCDYLHANPTSGYAPLTVHFSGKGYDPTRIKGYRFVFGNGEKREFLGSFTSSHVQETDYVYTSIGTFQAYLEILDDGDHWRTRNECKVTITVFAVPTNTPPPGATSTPPRATATPPPASPTEAAATSTPKPTSTRVPTATKAPVVQKEPTPTEIELPKAGIKIPTLTGILGGLLLISLGVVFVF